MKKPELKNSELVAAAQTAGADTVADSFWSDVLSELDRMNQAEAIEIAPRGVEKNNYGR